jgi:membrane protein DedA with SNARE-associated domain
MYTTIFIYLVLGGMGFPIPEELPLLLAGIAASSNQVSLNIAFGICYFGVLIGDLTMYSFGRIFGQKLLLAGARAPFLPGLTESRIQEVREGLRKKRLLYLFLGRHIFFLRSATFVVAGSLAIPLREFIFSDALAALFSVSLFLALGYFLGRLFPTETVTEIVHKGNIAIGILIFLGMLFFAYLRFRKRKKDPLEKATD